MTTKKLVYIDGDYTKPKWITIEDYSTGALKRSVLGKDPTIDQQINDKGGIYSHLDNKVYTSKANYLASIKEAGCHIKDY